MLGGLRDAARKLKAGDLFFLSYSGHGGQVPDVSGDEPDKQDETWCLHDGQLIDDELYLELSRFQKGVRILVLSDSCHSGTVTREMPPPGVAAGRSKAMPDAVAVIVPCPLPGAVANGAVFKLVFGGQIGIAEPLVCADPYFLSRFDPRRHPHLAVLLAVGAADRPADFSAATVHNRNDGRTV